MEQNRDRINVLCCTDDNYSIQYGVMLTSLFETNSDTPFHVWILTFGLSEENKNRFKSFTKSYTNVLLDIIVTDSSDYEYCPLHDGEHYTRSGYLPLFASSILPKEISKILYLDGDIIIQCSITDIWGTDIDDYALAAVIDVDSEIHKKRLKTRTTYFNSGVLLLNLEYARNHDLQSKYINRLKYLNCHRVEFVLHDQDVFNYVCDGHVVILPINYNLQTLLLLEELTHVIASRDEILRIISDGQFIVHYCYKNMKPWQNNVIAPPFTKQWLFYYHISPWRKVRFCDKISFKKRLFNILLKCFWFLHIKSKPKLFVLMHDF